MAREQRCVILVPNTILNKITLYSPNTILNKITHLHYIVLMQ
jgi:hypothetical protein